MADFFYTDGIPQVTPKQLIELVREGGTVVDLRPAFMRAWKQFDLSNVVWAEAASLEDLIKEFPVSKTFILSETSSSEKTRGIIRRLRGQGYYRVFNLAGGFLEWERGGFPVKEDKKSRLSGSCMCQLKPRNLLLLLLLIPLVSFGQPVEKRYDAFESIGTALSSKQMIIFEGSAHEPFLEEPDLFVSTVNQFVDAQ